VPIIGIAGQAASRHCGLAIARQYRNTVPAFLPLPGRTVTGRADCGCRKLLAGRSELLKTGDIRPHLLQPVEQIGEATIDAVDIVGRDPHDRSYRVAEPTPQALPRYRAIGNWSQDGGQPAEMGRAAMLRRRRRHSFGVEAV